MYPRGQGAVYKRWDHDTTIALCYDNASHLLPAVLGVRRTRGVIVCRLAAASAAQWHTIMKEPARAAIG